MNFVYFKKTVKFAPYQQRTAPSPPY